MRVGRILIRALVPLAVRHLAMHKLAAAVTTIAEWRDMSRAMGVERMGRRAVP